MQPRAARFSFESKKRNHVGLVDLDVRHTTASLGCSCSWFNVAFAKDPFKVGKVKERLVITLPYIQKNLAQDTQCGMYSEVAI